ncbi:hypothetical protein B4U79_04894, partial [Dinothrombium tinctorium]
MNSVRGSDSVTHVTDIIGNFGKWQLNICMFCTSMAIFSSFNNLVGPFYAPKINYYCTQLKNGSVLNISNTEEVCMRKEECLQWRFDENIFHKTIIDE